MDYGYEYLGAFFVIFLLIVGVISLISLTIKIVGRWLYFKKCGEEGWKALIPIYTDVTLIKTADLNWWWILILYVGAILSCFQSSLNIMNSTESLDPALLMLLGIISILSIFGSLASLFAKINIGFNIGKKFKKDIWLTILYVFFPNIMTLVIALSKGFEYDASVEVSKNGVIGIKKNTARTQTEASKATNGEKFCTNCGSKMAASDKFCGNCGKN